MAQYFSINKKIFKKICQEFKVSEKAKGLFLCLNVEYSCYKPLPKYEQIAKDLELNQRSIRRQMRELIKCDLIREQGQTRYLNLNIVMATTKEKHWGIIKTDQIIKDMKF